MSTHLLILLSLSNHSVTHGYQYNAQSMSYATSAKATKTKAAKSQEASSKATKAKASKSYSMSYCERSECVDPNVPRFIVDGSEDIGDTLRHEPGMTKRCGCDCYTLKDDGDDPPYDPQEGDTQRFAYKKVTSTNFSIKSRTCGTKCYVGDEVQPPHQLTYGRVGLQVRASLDPLAASVFISHKPHAQAEWSWRKEYNGTYTPGFDGSPDVECLWITLTRDGNNFNSTYAYDPQAEGEVCESEFDIGLDQHVVIDMPDEVYVGMAVSSEIYNGPNTSCEYTKAAFESIEFVCEGDGC